MCRGHLFGVSREKWRSQKRIYPRLYTKIVAVGRSLNGITSNSHLGGGGGINGEREKRWARVHVGHVQSKDRMAP